MIGISDLIAKLKEGIEMAHEIARLDPLFETEADYEEFSGRHFGHSVKNCRA